MLKQRSFWGWFFLTIITCGIYGLYWVYVTTKSVNQLAQGDNRDFNPALALVLYIVTCGIYPIIWYYTQGERLKDTGTRMGVQVQESGVTYLLWMLVGALPVSYTHLWPVSIGFLELLFRPEGRAAHHRWLQLPRQ